MKIFLTGATGYIGNAVALGFVKEGHDVSGLVRSDAGKPRLESQGITPISGTLDDVELLAAEAAKADLVVQASDADHPASIEALLDGVAGRDATYIHTSGTGIYADGAEGKPSDAVYSERDTPDLTEHKQGRWDSEQAVLAKSAGKTRTIVVRPSMAFGLGRSIQVPLLIDVAKHTGTGRYLGEGLNRWSNVQIDDLVDFYLLAATKAEGGSVYNVASGEETIKSIAESTSRMLGYHGETATMTVEEGVAFKGFDFWWEDLASNSRVTSQKARSELGWAPNRPGILHDIEFGSYASANAS